MYKLLCDVTGLHHNAQNSDVSLPCAPPRARALEKYDISDYCGGNNVPLSNILSEIIFHTIPSLV